LGLRRNHLFIGKLEGVSPLQNKSLLSFEGESSKGGSLRGAPPLSEKIIPFPLSRGRG